MKKPLSPLVLAALASLALPAPLAAGGPSVKSEEKGGKYKYEYKDERCHFKYEFKYGKGEEKRSRKGDCSHVGHFPQFAPPRVTAGGGTGRPAQPDYRRACNSDRLGLLPGAGAGAAIGSQIGSGGTKAVIAGAVLGGLLGKELGRRLDDNDRSCIGSALEYGGNGELFDFFNPASGLRYSMRPQGITERQDSRCRNFDARFDGGGWQRGLACRNNGSWEIVELE